ncbi:hypothetical protein CIW54_23845 [Paraburkholderia sp. T12-10]|nr:hypothetical protein CIW54_23845 [Paraburkholderia sp. T12-10]
MPRFVAKHDITAFVEDELSRDGIAWAKILDTLQTLQGVFSHLLCLLVVRQRVVRLRPSRE